MAQDPAQEALALIGLLVVDLALAVGALVLVAGAFGVAASAYTGARDAVRRWLRPMQRPESRPECRVTICPECQAEFLEERSNGWDQ